MGRAGRTARGLATRARIVEVAGARFVVDGYLSTTVADIARDAGMSAQAVYLAFGSKSAVLAAAYETAAADDEESESSVTYGRWRDEFARVPDGSRALDLAVDRVSDLVERTGPIVEVCHAVAADPEVAKLLESLTRQRMSLWQELASQLAEKQGFRRGLTVERARDSLYTVVGHEPWRALTRECGWTTQEWRDFIRQSARVHVLDLASADSPPVGPADMISARQRRRVTID